MAHLQSGNPLVVMVNGYDSTCQTHVTRHHMSHVIVQKLLIIMSYHVLRQ